MQTTLPNPTAAPFWDKIAPKYAKQPIADPAAYAEKLSRVRALLRAEDRMLEIGCGTGSTALTLAPAVAEMTATDISQAMVRIANEKRDASGLDNIKFVQAAAQARVGDGGYDVVAAFSLLHLVDDVPAVLAAVFAQLRPGGLFVSKTVCLGDASVVLRLFVRALRFTGFAPKVTMLRKQDLRDALIEAGFDIVESRHFGKGRFNPFFIAQRPV